MLLYTLENRSSSLLYAIINIIHDISIYRQCFTLLTLNLIIDINTWLVISFILSHEVDALLQKACYKKNLQSHGGYRGGVKPCVGPWI